MVTAANTAAGRDPAHGAAQQRRSQAGWAVSLCRAVVPRRRCHSDPPLERAVAGRTGPLTGAAASETRSLVRRLPGSLRRKCRRPATAPAVRNDRTAPPQPQLPAACGRRLRAPDEVVAAGLCCAGHSLLLGGRLAAMDVAFGGSVLLPASACAAPRGAREASRRSAASPGPAPAPGSWCGFRGGGVGDSSAWRTVRRCTPGRAASWRIEESSRRASRRIASNSSSRVDPTRAPSHAVRRSSGQTRGSGAVHRRRATPGVSSGGTQSGRSRR